MFFKIDNTYRRVCFMKYVIDRHYQKKKILVEKFIKKNKKTDHSIILNEINIDYDTLMKIMTELKRDGRIK
jgi:hypothetical protein